MRPLSWPSKRVSSWFSNNSSRKSREPGVKKRFQWSQRIVPPTQGWPVTGIQQPPPPQAQRPDYGRPSEQERYVSPYVMNYGHLTPEEHQRELDEARRVTLNIQWDRQHREAAEREWREREEAHQVWQDRMVQAGFMEAPNVPAGPPPVGISTETRP